MPSISNGELRRRQRDHAAGLDHPRPDEAALIEPRGEQAQAVPVPEKNLDDLRLLAAEGEQMAAEWILLQRALNQHRQPVHALSHVGVAQRQMHFHAGRKSSSRRLLFENMSPYRVRIAAVGREHPSPVGQFDRRHAVGRLQQIVSTSGVEAAPDRPSASFTAASFARSFSPKPNWMRQGNTMLVAMSWRRQIAATLTSACFVSITMASFSSSVKLRRFERRSRGESLFGASVKTFRPYFS